MSKHRKHLYVDDIIELNARVGHRDDQLSADDERRIDEAILIADQLLHNRIADVAIPAGCVALFDVDHADRGYVDLMSLIFRLGYMRSLRVLLSRVNTH